VIISGFAVPYLEVSDKWDGCQAPRLLLRNKFTEFLSLRTGIIKILSQNSFFIISLCRSSVYLNHVTTQIHIPSLPLHNILRTNNIARPPSRHQIRLRKCHCAQAPRNASSASHNIQILRMRNLCNARLKQPETCIRHIYSRDAVGACCSRSRAR
jgi:hypothetical protein